MVSDYIRAVMAQAQYHSTSEEDAIYGEIPGFEGVQAEGATLEDCRHHLSEALEDWICFRMARKLPLPEIEGVKSLNKD